MIKLNKLETVSCFVGLPGSGKTTIAASIVKSVLKLQKKDTSIRVFSNVPIVGAIKYSWQDFGYKDMANSYIILDESGLEVDCRNWEKNFDRKKVEFLKLLRHYKSKLIYFSQTWNDTDTKIRAMTSKLFICRHSLLPFCTVAIPVWRKIDVDKETEEFKECYNKDGWFLSIFSCSRIFRPFYYKMFDSWSAPVLPDFIPLKIYGKENL